MEKSVLIRIICGGLQNSAQKERNQGAFAQKFGECSFFRVLSFCLRSAADKFTACFTH
jgi:hypothetical protein